MKSYCLTGTEFPYGTVKKVLDLDGGDDCTTM